MTITLLQLSPLITAAITAQPRTGERAVRGAELLRAGKVQRLPDDVRGDDHWLVYGSAAHPYQVSIEKDTCDCPDKERNCKHLHAVRFALALGMEAPQEIDPDPELWAPASADNLLDMEIAAKLANLVAAGLDAQADLLVIGDWIWIVGDVDPAQADALGCRWHDRRNCHYWRPVWATVQGYNEHASLPELAQKYGIKKQIARRGQTAVDLAMMLIPKLNRDEAGELWA